MFLSSNLPSCVCDVTKPSMQGGPGVWRDGARAADQYGLGASSGLLGSAQHEHRWTQEAHADAHAAQQHREDSCGRTQACQTSGTHIPTRAGPGDVLSVY